MTTNPASGYDVPEFVTWSVGSVQLVLGHSTDRTPWIARLVVGGTVSEMSAGLPLLDVVTMEGGHDPASGRLVHTSVGEGLRYRSHQAHRVTGGEQLSVELHGNDGALIAVSNYFVPDGCPVMRAWSEVRNASADRVLVLRSATTFSVALGRTANELPRSWVLREASSDWLAEGRWADRDLEALLPEIAAQLTGHDPRGSYRVVSTGNWSTGRALPTAALLSKDAVWAWQIEHNGGWRWDVGADTADAWFALSGPTDDDHGWSTVLSPGESFATVPGAVTLAGTFEAAVSHLTQYRRAIRRRHWDNTALPVVFNDYMNTLNGDPTTERLLPLIDAAADVGCEVFCIDAGWYADGPWWDSVGEWLPSPERFPAGLDQVVDRIRSRGMTPGLWLEPEVVGVRSPIARRLPEDAFLSRHGQMVVEHQRYHLDLRHPAATAHLDAVIDRLVDEFGIGYFKFDYNINPGPGTDRDAVSPGDGLLQHNRAHLAWLDRILDRHPRLIVENCGSGAMRSDFAMLSRLQLQSTSDQQDYLLYPPIAASAPAQMLPEQAANWAYPQPEMTAEEAAFCLTTGLVGRFYLSGYLNRMSGQQRSMVGEAVEVARELRDFIRVSQPFWPLGLPDWNDDLVALGLGNERVVLIALWDRNLAESTFVLPLPDAGGKDVQSEQVFPRSLPTWGVEWDTQTGTAHVSSPAGSIGARLFRIRLDN